MIEYAGYLFDVGGTLITFDERRRAEEYVKRAASVGVTISTAETMRVLDALTQELPERSQHLPLSLLPAAEQRAFWVDIWAEGFRRIGVSADDAVRFAAELLDAAHGGDFQDVFEDVVPALDALKARGKLLGIISNFSPNCESLLGQLGLAHYFDFFIVSGIVGIEKPDPRIFELAIHAAAKRPAELVYVGDSVFHDVQGALQVGMGAALIDRADRFPEFEKAYPGVRIRDLREL